MADYEVAIVGFGPVGAVAACLLGQAGIRTLVIDRSEAIYDKPRAVALDHEIARVLQGIGLADALADCAEPFTDSVYFGADGRVIKRLTMLPEPHPQGWTPSMVFMQPTLEAAVRDRVRAFPSVNVKLGQTLTDLRQDSETAFLDIEGPAGRKTITAHYVIGCDGASSTVRKLADLPREDLGFDEPWLVVDVLANARGLEKLPKTSVQYCEPARPTTYVICTGSHRRWELRLLEGENPGEMEKPENVWRLLARWITAEDATLWRSASYRFHALVGASWRQKRVFIAGDAAHQQPPFLGQGLCQGIRDVANLGWKLIRCIQGSAGDALLDTYGPERAGHVRKLTGIIKSIGGLIGERDLACAHARDDRLIAEAGGTIVPVPRQDLMPALDCGFVSASPHPGRGTLFPQPWIAATDGKQRLDDVAGGGLRLITIADAHLTDDLRRRMAALGGSSFRMASGASIGDALTFTECDTVVRDWFTRHGTTYALVRPDNYVFGVASDSASAKALIDEAASLLR
jgi:3-(3-hydroxy-phenyl)propionate hydroxylase